MPNSASDSNLLAPAATDLKFLHRARRMQSCEAGSNTGARITELAHGDSKFVKK